MGLSRAVSEGLHGSTPAEPVRPAFPIMHLALHEMTRHLCPEE